MLLSCGGVMKSAWSNWFGRFNARFPRERRRNWLLLLLALELCGAYNLTHFVRKEISLGFLVKNGSKFIVAWRDTEAGFQTRSYESVDEAMSFARKELKLIAARNPLVEHELEHVWLDNSSGGHMVVWKVLRFDFLNRLSFQNQGEAEFFLQAFRSGSYAPSIFGHSILLRPSGADIGIAPVKTL